MRWVVAFLATVMVLLGVRGKAYAKSQEGDPLRLEVPGQPDAFYYKPRGTKGLKPVIMYLHGRGGNPAEDCRKWARTAVEFGWLVCPQGPEDRGGGARAWSNGAGAAQKEVDSVLTALREKFGRRVQLRGNILVGFSEGAFIAQQIGLAEQRVWNRWLILAASDQYWVGGDTQDKLKDKKVKRVYLLTGENDGVAQNTVKAGEMLKKNDVPVKVRLVPGMGHEVPHDRMVMYRRPLLWLASIR